MDNNYAPYKGYFNLKNISYIVRFLTLADLIVISGFGLVAPIFAVFITESISGGTVEVVGTSAMIYLIIKSIGQIPIGRFIDKKKGERDDFWFLFSGYFLYGLIILSYIKITNVVELYITQALMGLAASFVFPSWYAIFTRHIDKNKEGIEWGVYNTLIDVGGAVSAGLGGFIVAKTSFNFLFLLTGLVVIFGALMLLVVYKQLRRT